MSTDLPFAIESKDVRNNLRKATHSGIMRIGNAEIKCYVLEPVEEQDPVRALSGRAVTQAFLLSGRTNGMMRFLDSKRISSKMSERLKRAIEEPILFTVASSGLPQPHGYEAWILPELCFAIM